MAKYRVKKDPETNSTVCITGVGHFHAGDEFEASRDVYPVPSLVAVEPLDAEAEELLRAAKQARSPLPALPRQEAQKADRAEEVDEADFVRAIEGDANGIVTGENAVMVLRAEAAATYGDFVREKRQKPSRKDVDEISAALLSKVTRERRYWLDTEEFEFQRRARERDPMLDERLISTRSA
jgi:hypothetical protein